MRAKEKMNVRLQAVRIVRKLVLITFASLIAFAILFFGQWRADRGRFRQLGQDSKRTIEECCGAPGTNVGLCGQEVPGNVCPRPSPKSAVPEPADLRSHNGVLKVDLTIHSDT